MIPRTALTLLASAAISSVSAGAQEFAGCWTGNIGSGNDARRAVLEVASGGAAPAGALHVLSRNLETDSLAEVSATDSTLAFTVRRPAGPRRFEGQLSSGRLQGRVTSDTLSQPFAFERAAPGPDSALALTGYWRGGLYQGDALIFRMGLEFVPVACGQVMLTLDSPDQNTENLPVTAMRVEGDSLFFEMSYLGAAFRGVVAPGATGLSGEWSQGGNRLPLRVERSDSAASFARPQDPRPPFPYSAEDVTYHNARDSTRFAGTLTIPPGDGPFPAVVLITGSGAQNRDEAIMGHRPFLVIADHLTRNGIAVLRSDDRGVGGSTGNTMTATIPDNAGDVQAAVNLLRADPRIDAARVGLVGHSEGGWVAPLVANQSDAVAFVVMIAGPAVSGEEILYAQTRAMSEASGVPPAFIDGSEAVARKIYSIIKAEPDSARTINAILALTDTVTRSLPPAQRAALDSAWAEPGRAEEFEQGLAVTVTPWFRYLLAYEPAAALSALRVPVLALFGELDLQVPPAQSVPLLERLWAGHPDATIHVFPRLNHLFQHAEKGLVAEYATIEETFAEPALEMMTAWILERAGRR
jgi:hypothetical protein